MKLETKDLKLFIDRKYFCDIYSPVIPKGTYDVEFVHVERFNAIMPVLKDVPDEKEVTFCWCKELCNKEMKCTLCNAIQVGRYFSGKELLTERNTFNQLYYKIRHRLGKDKQVEIAIL